MHRKITRRRIRFKNKTEEKVGKKDMKVGKEKVTVFRISTTYDYL